MVSSAAKRARKKKLAHERHDRELFRPTHQMDPADTTDPEILQAECEYDVVNMIKTLNGAIAQ